MKFGAHEAQPNRGYTLGTQYEFSFPNGYGASVITGPYAHGGEQGLWELAVMKGGHLNYETPITSDVIGYLSTDEVAAHLDAIEALTQESVIQGQIDRERQERDEEIAELEAKLAELRKARERTASDAHTADVALEDGYVEAAGR
jgi:hypothetical protein